MDSKKITATEIVENEILGGIDHLFHVLTADCGYSEMGKVKCHAWAESLKKMLAEYIDCKGAMADKNEKIMYDDLLESLKEGVKDVSAS